MRYVFVSFMGFIGVAYAQDTLQPDYVLDTDPGFEIYYSKDYPRSIEILAYHPFGIGGRYTLKTPTLWNEYSIYVIDDSWPDGADYMHYMDSLYIYQINPANLTAEAGVRAGFCYCPKDIVSFSLNALIAHRSEKDQYSFSSIRYELDTLDGQVIYLDKEGNRTAVPTGDIYSLLYTGWRHDNYLRMGLSPSIEVHARYRRLVFSFSIMFDFTYNFHYSTRKDDYFGIFPEPRLPEFSTSQRAFFAIGWKY